MFVNQQQKSVLKKIYIKLSSLLKIYFKAIDHFQTELSNVGSGWKCNFNQMDKNEIPDK